MIVITSVDGIQNSVEFLKHLIFYILSEVRLCFDIKYKFTELVGSIKNPLTIKL